jgi:ParB-like chromosome segregation protein Spo0J
MNGQIRDVDQKIPNVEHVDPKSLRAHPLNKWLYGPPDLPADFVESIRNGGVREPLRVTQAGTIVSGHRRQAGAIKAGCELVPIVIEPEALDDLAIRRELIISNKQREKTVEQRTREFDELAGVEKELAKQRQAQGRPPANGKKKTSGKNPGTSGEAKDIAAKQVGMDRKTAEKASEVVKAIDAAEAAGNGPRAAELRDKLQNKSVAAAHRAARPDAAVLKAEMATYTPAVLDKLGGTIPRRLEGAFAICSRFRAVLITLRNLQTEANKVAELPGGEELKDRAQAIEIDLKNLRAGWRFAEPYCVCPDCKASGKECRTCSKRGWIVEEKYTVNFKKRHLQPIPADRDGVE